MPRPYAGRLTPGVTGDQGVVREAEGADPVLHAVLDRLDVGEDAARREMSRGPSLFIRLTGERERPEVVVEDEGWSMVTVRVPLVPPDDRIADHRRLLRRGMVHWVPMPAGHGQ
ncbi:DUF5959 family protein [Streptomyces sp. YIM 132580]|uniref:DUF5959 family protein n=1 Tax=Streptomyces sp. YIM 132580 TaxID=2691958 RepID=UPI0013717066|nr:DUF5959 family protein [Streptomyces sp. YIM 132580]MXG28373.1 hypothetical protein [Streptomyces sp. YIM 132580]